MAVAQTNVMNSYLPGFSVLVILIDPVQVLDLENQRKKILERRIKGRELRLL
ncbi:unnamed protein product [Meloidogyne enterolobii]|uniref:Uncharacterized protein n=1 Tax=Meloidogyne enterolobii TaxID=390850 RepID=A0ACB0YSZ5_MELEN